jgi:excisionase family DNA binding protein
LRLRIGRQAGLSINNHSYLEASVGNVIESLPHLRFEIKEAAQILRISRATLYERIRDGRIAVQKDGRRTFVTAPSALR